MIFGNIVTFFSVLGLTIAVVCFISCFFIVISHLKNEYKISKKWHNIICFGILPLILMIYLFGLDVVLHYLNQ